MTQDEFRKIALALPETTEAAHMGHPDFRVGGKIFATLLPHEECGMVKLTPDTQEALIDAFPDVFKPVNGSWGRKGATLVRLANATAAVAREGLLAAWRDRAPKRLVRSFDANRS